MFVFDTDLGEILHDARSHREQEFDEYNNQSKKTRKNMNDLSNTNSLDMKSKLVSPFASKVEKQVQAAAVPYDLAL